MNYHKYTFLLLLVLLMPAATEASHRSGVDRDKLDDDIVEELPIPVLFGVELADVVPDFGAPRGGGTREHEGQDFMVPLGTPIVSPTEAIVLSTGVGASAGKFVYTANPGGETFRYMHLDEIADLDPGDELDVGDFIGTVGDTGNAPEGAYHLHFETRDDDNDAQDPYPRLGEAFDLEDKMKFLRDVFRDRTIDDDEYAEYLVTTFSSDFRAALAQEIDMPRQIEEALDDAGMTDVVGRLAALEKLVRTLPAALGRELSVGDSGPEVILLQLYLIYLTDGSERDRLAAAGATGYYGGITAAAVSAYQATYDVPVTGVYDRLTRLDMIANDDNELNI